MYLHHYSTNWREDKYLSITSQTKVLAQIVDEMNNDRHGLDRYKSIRGSEVLGEYILE